MEVPHLTAADCVVDVMATFHPSPCIMASIWRIHSSPAAVLLPLDGDPARNYFGLPLVY